MENALRSHLCSAPLQAQHSLRILSLVLPPPRAPVVYAPPPIPFYNWDGFYVGGDLKPAGARAALPIPLGKP